MQRVKCRVRAIYHITGVQIAFFLKKKKKSKVGEGVEREGSLTSHCLVDSHPSCLVPPLHLARISMDRKGGKRTFPKVGTDTGHRRDGLGL